jgi:subtilisin family serine protease
VDQNSERERYSSVPGDDCRIQERWMVAPGTVTGAVAQSNTGTTTASGTSFAAPQVAGAAALVKEAFPSLSNHGVLRLLLSTASREFAAYNPDLHGQGLLDVGAVLAADPAKYLDGTPDNLRAICTGG